MDENEKKLTKEELRAQREADEDARLLKINEAADRLEIATEEARKYGVTEAGQATEEKGETQAEYAERISSGL